MAPRNRRDEDLFNDSSMSFGDHLMELRRCLIIAILWLVGGFLIALIPLGPYPSLSTSAVSYIQRPLKRALETFYINQSTDKLERQTKLLKEFGYSDQLSRIPKKYNMTPHQYWVFPEDIDKANMLPNATVLSNQRNLKDNPATAEEGPQGASLPNMPATSASAPAGQNQNLPENANSAASVSSGSDPSKPVLVVLWEKLEDDPRTRTKALNMPETFVIFIKAAVIIGIVIGSPGIFYSFWSFVGAGLYAHEKRIVYRFLPLSLGLFIGGFCLAFFVVFQMVLAFLLRFNAGMNIDPDPRISEWLNFALILPVGFGIVFQLPLVMFALHRLRIFTVQDYMARWKISIFVISVLSMMFTPPDPWSMICMMVPLVFLYFSGVYLCWFFPLPPNEFDDTDEVPVVAES